MAEIASAWVSILPSTRNFGARLTSSVSADSKKAGKTGGLSFGKVFAAAAAFGIGAKVGSFLGDSIGEAREAQKVGATTEQIIRSTGGAAKLTAAQVGDLATALSRKTGIDDEAIQSGANLLLTFKNVKREGEGLNDIFGRATAAAADLSAAGFGDLNGASKQLGKALNDPIKGMAALSKSGVTFTEGQKKRIGNLVKENNLLGAQKIILREVESQVGGVAEATATSGDKAKVAIGNIKEAVGTALLPLIDRISDAFVRIAPAIEDGVGQIGPIFAKIKQTAAPVLDAFGGFIKRNPTFVKAFAISLGVLAGAIGVVTLATTAFSIALNSTGIPIVIIAIAALVAGLVVAYKKSADFRSIVNGVADAFRAYVAFIRSDVIPVAREVAGFIAEKLKPVFKQLGDTIRTDILPTVNRMVAKFRENQPAIQRVVGAILRVVAAMVKFNVTVLAKVLPPLIRFTGFLIRTTVPIVYQMIVSVVQAVRILYRLGAGFVAAGRAVDRFAQAVARKIQEVMQTIRQLPATVNRAIGNLGSVLYNAGRELIGGLISGITSKISELRSKVSEVASIVRDHFPGSPVKTGPLQSFNRGMAGRRLMQMLGEGITAGEPALAARLGRVAARTAGLTLPVGTSLNATATRPLAAAGGGRHAFLTITNWDEGTGYIREQADGSVGFAANLAGQRRRAGYVGQPA